MILSSGVPKMQSSNGNCFWLTGYSGAGKTTIGTLFKARLDGLDRSSLLLDGDLLRTVFGNSHGYAPADRLKLGLSYGQLCREITVQGVNVICATISMFHQVHEWNRENIPNYREIYLRVPSEELERRDPKGLYKGARANIHTDMVGLDLTAEEPESPDLVIDNYSGMTPETALDMIWDTFVI